MKRRRLSYFLIPFAFLAAAPALVAQGAAEPLSCADRSVTASAVHTPEDVKAFVQCAYEFVQEMGFEEAHRAFNEDERWRSGPTYLFVAEVAPLDQARLFVFPPARSREGSTLGVRIDVFGNNFREERNRIVTHFGEGWSYYAFRNPATDREEPKAAYIKSIDWDGNSAATGAGVYRHDIPGTCESEEVNAMGLEDDPSPVRLKEFVRCAAMELESEGYFASRALTVDPRWRSRSIYLFGLDTYGNTLLSGSSSSSGIPALASKSAPPTLPSLFVASDMSPLNRRILELRSCRRRRSAAMLSYPGIPSSESTTGLMKLGSSGSVALRVNLSGSGST